MEEPASPPSRSHHDIEELFQEAKHRAPYFLCVSAPMVRYSKFEFRRLLRRHGVQLCFTPMIVADSFLSSEKARQNEFTTSDDEGPLIVQFAAHNALEFRKAAELIYPYADGVDLNCGCPQTWAIAKGYGCALLRQSPEVVKDYIRQIRNTLPTHFSVSAKIRLLCGPESTSKTVDYARQLESCGLTFLSVHGRTITQKSSEPINCQALQDLKASLSLPLVANGNVRNWQDACSLYRDTLADGIMAARGLLTNPGLFSPALYFRHTNNGHASNGGSSSVECLLDWLAIEEQAQDQLQFQCFHHHLTFMWSRHLNRVQRQKFNAFTRKVQIRDFMREHFDFRTIRTENSADQGTNTIPYTKCTYPMGTILACDGDIFTTSEGKGKFYEEFQDSWQKTSQKTNVDLQGCDLADSFLLNII